MTKIQRAVVAVAAAGGLAWASVAGAQIPLPAPVPNPDAKAANAAFPLQNPQGPSGANYQVNYPYPGQCLASSANAALFPSLALATCDKVANSFTCDTSGVSQRSAGSWAGCGAPSPFQVLSPVFPTVAAAGVVGTPKFVWEVLNPPDYAPDTAKYPGADYYEIGLHEANGFQGLASAGLFPNPPTGLPVPSGMQWTGLVCNIPGGCACPADASTTFRGTYCTAGGKIPVGNPLFTPIWGVGQINMGGGPVTGVLSNLGKCSKTTAQTCVAGAVAPSPLACPVAETCNVFSPPLFQAGTPSSWSANNYVATWPSISIRATAGRPVVVKWVNEFPNTHVLCPHPEAADWPCAIDRTFMGVKAKIDHALAGGTIPPDGVNQFGSPQQPDNSWVTHLHGGEIPASTDGFAMKWFGNANTAAAYNGVAHNYVMPPFENPSSIALKRPTGNSDVYTYPMTQDEATIWFHDHSIGKTHHNVIAGPAGFFPVKDPARHGKLTNWIPGSNNGVLPAGSEYTWLDPVTEPRDALGVPMYDMFFAIQDRAFNEDGSINFSNGLGQTPLPIGLGGVPGQTPVTAGVNPLVHPTWVPEYFGDHALVNGVLWPKKTVAPGYHRIRLVNGSDSRCYTLGLLAKPNPAPGVPAAAPAPGADTTLAPDAPNVRFWVIANDQGYLGKPVQIVKGGTFSMCPGERVELLVDFGTLQNGIGSRRDATVFLTNSAAAPFPFGIPPFGAGTPWPDMNVIMRFDVRNAAGPGVLACASAGAPVTLSWDPALPWEQNMATACMPDNPRDRINNTTFKSLVRRAGRLGLQAVPPPAPGKLVVRHVYLNERLDGITLMPLGMQLNGVPFEYKVTETPSVGSREVWKFINLTVDTHPMHPHLVKHQIVRRDLFNMNTYKTDLCGSPTCQPGPAPGNEMQVVPNIDGVDAVNGLPYITGPSIVNAWETGWKDVVQTPPGEVTTIVADWTAHWPGAGTPGFPVGTPNAPGTAGCPGGACGGPPWIYESVTSGPYVWHCHINSHEDSEMMRTSLVVP